MEKIAKPKARHPRNTIMFCEKPWKIPAMALAFMVALTFVWGAYIISTYPGDEYFDDVYDLSIPEFLFRDMAGTGATQISEAVAPGIVGISAAGINMQMISSGAIVSTNGHIITALHPVQGLREINVRVRTPSGIKQYRAEIVKTLPSHDLVLLKILTSENFMFFPLADTSSLYVGENVFGIGNGGAGNVIVKDGQVISINASLNIGGVQMPHIISTDAIYTWEQSGGPLVNARGEIVGISLSVKGTSRAIKGYAIPARVIIADFGDVIDFKIAGARGKKSVPGTAVAVPMAAMAPPSSTSQAAASSGGSASWWANARRQATAQGNPSLGMNVAAANGPPAMGNMANNQRQVNTDHMGGIRIGGFSVGDIFGLALLAVAVGITSGMMTMGGGVLQVAGMMVFFGYGMYLIRPVAYLTNIFVFGAAALRNDRSGLISWDVVKALAPWAVVGVVIGYFVGNALGNKAVYFLLGAFALLMTAKGLHEIFAGDHDDLLVKTADGNDDILNEAENLLNDELKPGKTAAARMMPEMASQQVRNVILGLPSGLVSGILGISGGVVAVPIQRFLNGASMQNAIATSSVIVFWASLAGALVSFMHGIPSGLIGWQAPLMLAAIMIPGAFAGGLIGARLMKLLPVIALKWFYTVIMAVIAIKMLLLG